MSTTGRSEAGPPPTGADPFRARLVACEAHVRAGAARLVAGTALAQEIDDVVQETFARALRGRATYDPARPLEPWLAGICVRVVADRHRAARTLVLDGGEAGAALEDGATEREHAALEARDEVARRLALLPREKAELLLAFHRDGRPIAELARAAGVPQGTIKARLSRARRDLAALADAREEGRR